MILSHSFYDNKTTHVAQELLGCFLVREYNGAILRGKIVETEAYCGIKDKASHAHRGKTPRTELMFGEPGYAYIYLIYGMYYCLNIVTEKSDYPAAVLIRAVEPIDGIETMEHLRKKRSPHVDTASLANGPGKLCDAFAISKLLNGHDLTKKDSLWIERGSPIAKKNIARRPRIGIAYAEEYRDKKWRYYIKNNPFISQE